MDIAIKTLNISIDTSEDNPYISIKASCYRDLEDVMQHSSDTSTVIGNMDVWYRLNSDAPITDIESYDKIATLDEWIDLESAVIKIDALFMIDGYDPMIYEGFVPTLIGVKLNDIHNI